MTVFLTDSNPMVSLYGYTTNKLDYSMLQFLSNSFLNSHGKLSGGVLLLF